MDDAVRARGAQGRRERLGPPAWRDAIIDLRRGRPGAEEGLWLAPHASRVGRHGVFWATWAMAAVSAEAGRTRIGPMVLNAQAPDEATYTPHAGALAQPGRSTTCGRCARAEPAPASP